MGKFEERNGFLFRRNGKKDEYIYENRNGLWNDFLLTLKE